MRGERFGVSGAAGLLSLVTRRWVGQFKTRRDDYAND